MGQVLVQCLQCPVSGLRFAESTLGCRRPAADGFPRTYLKFCKAEKRGPFDASGRPILKTSQQPALPPIAGGTILCKALSPYARNTADLHASIYPYIGVLPTKEAALIHLASCILAKVGSLVA